jgi:hypothetical protein
MKQALVLYFSLFVGLVYGQQMVCQPNNFGGFVCKPQTQLDQLLQQTIEIGGRGGAMAGEAMGRIVDRADEKSRKDDPNDCYTDWRGYRVCKPTNNK